MEHSSLYDPRNEHDSCGVGFIAQVNGRKSHKIIREAIQALCNLEHRGAIGGDMKTGDGAGILFQIPHRFFTRVLEFNLPQAGNYGVGFLFLPQGEDEAARARKLTEKILANDGAILLGWRQVSVRRSAPPWRDAWAAGDHAWRRRLFWWSAASISSTGSI